MISQALKRNNIKKGDTLVEATSGNTGIALALMAKVLGVNMVLVLPENSTIERIKTMRAYGAEVILTPAALGIEGSRDHALDLKYKKGYFRLNQFDNTDNSKAHYKTTGPEIWQQTQGKITHMVTTMGTTGTIMGLSAYFKEQNPEVQIYGLQPKPDAFIPGIRRWPKAYLPSIFDAAKVDAIIDIGQDEAETTMRALAKQEGIFAGVSSGAAAWAAVQVAKANPDAVIAFIVCDRGDRYLSTGLYNVNDADDSASA